MRPPVLNPLFAPLSALPGIGPKLEKLFARLLAARRAAAHRRSAVSPAAGFVDRRDQPKLSDVAPETVVTVAVTVDRHRPPPPNRPRAPYNIYTSDDTNTLTITYFNARPDYLEKLFPGRERYVSGIATLYDGHLQMVHPDRVVDAAGFAKLPLIDPVYPLTEGLHPTSCAGGRAGARTLPKLPEWQDADGSSATRFRDSPTRCAACIARRRRMISPESAAWSRLAYDELLAGQLALALLRAHLRKRAGRGTPPKAACARGSSPPCPTR